MIHWRRLAMAFAIVGALLAAVRPAAAHPHVFVDARAELVFDTTGTLTAVRHVWRFDEAFSAFATQGLATDDTGKVTREALQPLAKINVDALKDYDYFSFLHVAGKRYGFKIPTEYWLQMDGGQLTLFFTLPLMEQVKVSKRTLTLDVYDPGYFVDFTLVDSEPALLVNAPTGCDLKVQPKGEPDAASAAILSQIPATERQLPPDLQDMTKDLANRITVRCP
ncbi:MAG: DUF1007 family protein [Ancalomicrobiaceae bacterium]|nr:DUF1007 family protein [Ancalomicrobiaceae bacterium]